MSNVLRLAIVDPQDASREGLKNLLLGMDMVWLEAECSRYEFFADVVGQTRPDVGIINVDRDPEKALQLIDRVRETCAECCILVVSSSSDGQLILRAMRAGAKEFLAQPINSEDLAAALDRLGNQRAGAEGKSRSSTVIAIAGVSGGVGATSIAVNLGCILAADSRNSVALIDLDLALGDADVLLDAIPEYTLVDVAQNISRLDFALLKRSLTRHSSGLYLMPRPVQLQDAQHVTPDSLQRVLGLLKATFSHLIVDISKAFNELDLVALGSAKEVLLVTQLDLPCLRNVVRLMMSFQEHEGLKDKIRVVVNRAGLAGGQISLKKAQETIGRDIFWQIPNDYRAMVEMRNNGVPLLLHAPKAGITQSIQGLADALLGTARPSEEVEQAAGANAKWLAFWPRKGRGEKAKQGNE